MIGEVVIAICVSTLDDPRKIGSGKDPKLE